MLQLRIQRTFAEENVHDSRGHFADVKRYIQFVHGQAILVANFGFAFDNCINCSAISRWIWGKRYLLFIEMK